QMGVSELGRHFAMETHFPAVTIQSPDDRPATAKRPGRPSTSGWIGVIRDLRRLATETRRAWSLCGRLCRDTPDFVYFRASYLNPLPIFLRLRGIPCIVEANGIQFDHWKKFYRSHLWPLNRLIEKAIYRA